MTNNILVAPQNNSLSIHQFEAGDNRAPYVDSQIEADNDIAAVMAWLALFKSSPRTFSNYRKDVSRLIYWCFNYAEKPISGLRYEDILRFREFLLNPPAECIGSPDAENYDHRAQPLTEKWRPFKKPLSPNSTKQTFSVLRSMFEFLVNARYLKANPVILAMKSVRRPKHERERNAMNQDVLKALFEGIDNLTDESMRIRAQYIFRFLLFTGLRATEAVEAKVSGLYCEENNQWFLKVLGKGQKLRTVIFPTALFPYLEEMHRRAGIKCELNSANNTPLVFLSFSGKYTKARSITRQSLHGFLKTVCWTVADDMMGESPLLSEQIRSLHAHIFRHTAATMWIKNGASLADARDNLGHSSLATLSRYVHPELGDRHSSISKAMPVF